MKAAFSHINIRLVEQGDIPAVTAIYNQAVALKYVTADTSPVSEQSRAEIVETIVQKQQRPFWVAEENGKVTAFFYFRSFYDRPAYRITAEIGVYIDTSATGNGLGKFILDYCIQQAPSLGIENILALIFASNQPSIRLFEKAGFEKRGNFPGLAKSENGYNDLVIYVLKVS